MILFKELLENPMPLQQENTLGISSVPINGALHDRGCAEYQEWPHSLWLFHGKCNLHLL